MTHRHLCRTAVFGVTAAMAASFCAVSQAAAAPASAVAPAATRPQATALNADSLKRYTKEIRSLLSVSQDDVSDADLTSILSSPAGLRFEAYDDIAQFGRTALSADPDAAGSYADLVQSFIPYSDLFTLHGFESAALIKVVGEIFGEFAAGVLDDVIQIGQLLSGDNEFINAFGFLSSSPEYRFFLREYDGYRETDDSDGAYQQLDAAFPDNVVQLLGERHWSPEFFQARLESAHLANDAYYNPETKAQQRDALMGLVNTLDQYQSFDPSDPGFVLTYNAGGGFWLHNNGDAALTELVMLDDQGNALTDPAYASAGENKIVDMHSGVDRGGVAAIRFTVDDMPVSGIPLASVYQPFWLDGIDAVPDDADPTVYHLSIPEPQTSVDGPAHHAWTSSQGQSGFSQPADANHVDLTLACPQPTQVTVTSTFGQNAPTRQTTVGSYPFRLGWNSSVPNQAPGVPVTFSVTSSAPIPDGYVVSWDFGDGTTATGPSVDHAFTAVGLPDVTVSAAKSGSACPAPPGFSGKFEVGKSDSWIPLPAVVYQNLQLSAAVAGYVIPSGGTVIKPGVTVTTDPTVIIKASRFGSLVVSGSLVLQGDVGSPVVLTSATDDTAGGDFNGDGNATSPSTNDWQGIIVNQGGAVTMSNTQVRWAQFGIQVLGTGTTVNVTNSSITDTGFDAISTNQPGTLNITGSTLANGSVHGGTGISIATGTASWSPTIRSTQFSNLAVGVAVSGFVAGVIDGATFTNVDNDVYADPDASGTTLRNTTVNGRPGRYLVAGGSLSPGHAVTWTSDIPYVHYYTQPWTIPATASLTIGAGRVVKYSNTIGPSALVVSGSLVLQGDVGSPVVLTSATDDTAGGDFNGDGNATSPSTNDWQGIIVNQGGAVTMSNTQVRWAQFGIQVLGTGTTVNVTNSSITDTGFDAISTNQPGTLNITGSTLANGSVGLGAYGPATPIVHYSTFANLAAGIDSSTALPIDATLNWWSSASGVQATGGTIRVPSTVLYRPWCLDAACDQILDEVPPVVTGTPDRPSNAHNWWNASVTFNWTSVDPNPSSGVPTRPAPTTLSTDGANQVVQSTQSCDPAGNCATGTVEASIDTVAPTLQFNGPADGATVAAAAFVTPTCVAVDVLSGPDGCSVILSTQGSDARSTTYEAVATATDEAGNATTLIVHFSVLAATQPPGAPQAVSATAGNGSIVLAFQAPQDDGNSPISTYHATCQGATTVQASGVSPIRVNGTTNGQTYGCFVTAENAIGIGPSSTVVSVAVPLQPPDAPTSLTAEPYSTSAQFVWVAAASSGTPVSSYSVRCVHATTVKSATVVGSVTSATVTGLTVGLAYQCTTTAANAVGSGAASTAVTVTPIPVPGAPGSVVVTAGDASLLVAFAAPTSSGGSAISSYQVDCTPATGPVQTVTGASSPIAVTALTNGTSYSCTVRASNSVGQGPVSSVRTATPRTVPDAPTAGPVTVASGAVTLTWSSPAFNGGSAITGYTIICAAGTASKTVSAAAAATNATVTGLVNGTTYTCTIAAKNIAGTGPTTPPTTATPTH
jgi:hypothetical protein